MFGSVVLDIVIGLVFIYLLYSLLATILAEIISTVLGLRARNLANAIERMLTDQQSDSFYGDIFYFIRLGAGKTVKTVYWLFPIKSLKQYKTCFKNLGDEFYELPAIKYLSKDKLFSRPSYIHSQTFSRAMVELLKNKGDEDVRDELEAIYSALKKNLDGNEQTTKHLASLLVLANNDLEKFKAHIEEWYDEMMERAVGWYKRWVQLILMVIGFVIAVGMNVNTFEIVEKLSKDKNARDQLVILASNAGKYEPIIQQLQTTTELKKDSLTAIRADSIKMTLDEVKTKIDSLNRARQIVMKDIEEANKLIGFERKDGAAYITSRQDFLGFLITALAISLGAPFWFDLLNKLMKLRSSVPQQAVREAEPGRAGKPEIPLTKREG